MGRGVEVVVVEKWARHSNSIVIILILIRLFGPLCKKKDHAVRFVETIEPVHLFPDGNEKMPEALMGTETLLQHQQQHCATSKKWPGKLTLFFFNDPLDFSVVLQRFAVRMNKE